MPVVLLPEPVKFTGHSKSCSDGRVTVKTVDMRRGDTAIRSIPTTYCPRCRMLRAIRDWHEHGENLAIELDPCGHIVERTSRLEWSRHRAVA